jgi:hypothetical protein
MRKQCGWVNCVIKMSTSYQDHVERRIREMREREKMFRTKNKK